MQLQKKMEITEAGVLSFTALTFAFLAGMLSCILRSRCQTIDCFCSKCTRSVIDSVDMNTDVVVT